MAVIYARNKTTREFEKVGSAPTQVDSSLTLQGYPADAKSTGDAINEINDRIDELSNQDTSVDLSSITPNIGDNGNWFVGEEDTGVPATAGSEAAETSAANAKTSETNASTSASNAAAAATEAQGYRDEVKEMLDTFEVDPSEAVLITAQSLTETQQAQVRTNIGAVSQTDFDTLSNEKVDKTGVTLGEQDGNIQLFINGEPVGTGITQASKGADGFSVYTFDRDMGVMTAADGPTDEGGVSIGKYYMTHLTLVDDRALQVGDLVVDLVGSVYRVTEVYDGTMTFDVDYVTNIHGADGATAAEVIAAMTKETWTFTLEDGSTVTKVVPLV